MKNSIEETFSKYANTLPEKSLLKDPKMKYHILAGGVFWEDEGLLDIDRELEHLFRFVLNYRTNLIINDLDDDRFKKEYELAKKYFPNWIGFKTERCTYNNELATRIKRIINVSNWKIDKLEKSFDED